MYMGHSGRYRNHTPTYEPYCPKSFRFGQSKFLHPDRVVGRMVVEGVSHGNPIQRVNQVGEQVSDSKEQPVEGQLVSLFRLNERGRYMESSQSLNGSR